MAKISKKQKQESPVFDPSKNYKWEPEDEFVLGGLDYDILYKTLREATLQPAGTSALAIVESFRILERLLVQGVESGLIKEVPKEEPKKATKEVEKEA